VTAWRKAAGRFRKAETAARGSAAAQQARARYRTQIEGLDRAALGRVAGSHLRMALAADAAAEKALRDGQYDVAVRKWNQASALLGQAAARVPPASSPVP
jgi:hypothetical protein